jgi:hypothetical protein
MTYYSDRHYERVNGFKPNYLKDEVNMERSKKDISNATHWALVVLLAGVLLIGLIWSDIHKVQHIQQAACHEAYVQGELGTYCQ